MEFLQYYLQNVMEEFFMYVIIIFNYSWSMYIIEYLINLYIKNIKIIY